MTCVASLTIAYVMHALLVNMCAYYHEKFLTLIYSSKQFCGMIMENVGKHSFAYSYSVADKCLINCYDVHMKTMFGSHLPPVVCWRGHVLFALFVFVCA